MTERPERIWATAYYSQNRSEHVREWSTRGFEDKQDVEYIRADLATPAPREDGYSAGVRAAAEQCDFADSLELSLHGVEPTRQRILALLDAPALPDARAGAVEPVAWRVRVKSDDPEEWSLLPAGGGADYLDRKGYECQPLGVIGPTPACTATDGPASACVYRAPGLGTAATEKG